MRNIIRDSINFVRSVPIGLNFVAITTLIVVSIKVFVLNKIPELVLGFQGVGIIVEGVLASILASYVFYLVVVHTKDRSDQQALYPMLQRFHERVVGRYKALVAEIEKASGQPLVFQSFTEEDLHIALSQISPNAEAPMVKATAAIEHYNWLEYFNIINSEVRLNIEKIETHYGILSSEIISNISEIQNSSYMEQVTSIFSLRHLGINNKDMTWLSKCLFKHIEMCRKLEFNASQLVLLK